MKNILITGGAGFIGSHLADRLLDEGGWRVTVVDDFNNFYSPAIKRSNLAKHRANKHFELVEADIRDVERLKQVFAARNFDAVAHLAARAGVRPSLRQPALYAETNIQGTLNLLELTRESDVRQFIFASSSSVYGINSELPFNECAAVGQPISPYAATKAAGELLCHTYAHLYGIRAICLRFFTVYGSRQRPDLAIHKFARLISEGSPIPVFGDGSTRRDYTYIEDVIKGVRAAIDYAETDFEIINLGGSRTIELGELIALLEKNLGRKAIIKRLPPQAGDVPATFADIAKGRRLLGYNPNTPLETGIERFVKWFSEQPRFKDSECIPKVGLETSGKKFSA